MDLIVLDDPIAVAIVMPCGEKILVIVNKEYR